MSPRLRVYTYSIGAAFWVALFAHVTMHPGALGDVSRMAPLIALALLGEELVVRQREQGRGAAISFSAVAHIAAALLLDPVAAAATAALGIVIGDGLRSDGRRFLLVNSAMFGGSTWIASLVAHGLVGDGPLGLHQAPALLAVVGVRYAVTTTIFCGGIAIGGGGRFFPLLWDAGLEELGSALGEGSLGVLVAVAVLGDPVILPFLLPLFAALYLSKANFERLRTETQQALNAMADVIDARDPSTAAHSERVAGYVEQVVEALGLSHRDADRLVVAARYHDLGKIAVDVQTLTSAEKLTDEDLAQIRRHPRLSAQLLRPFSFARDVADVTELHHERYDGRGYYGVAGASVPIESHLLVVADSFDAMTSARAYRPALGVEEALEELRDKAGSQFHPLVARAFAAVISGEPLELHLTRAEVAELRSLFDRGPRIRLSVPRTGSPRPFVLFALAGVLVMAGAGATAPETLAVPAGAGLVGAVLWASAELRMRRRRGRMRLALDSGVAADATIAAAGFVGSAGWLPLAEASPIRSEIRWRNDELGEAQSWARRRLDAHVVGLAGGATVIFSGRLEGDCHYVLLLPQRIRPGELALAETLASSLAARADGPGALAPVARRSGDDDQRVIIRVDLGVFERTRLGAGQLVAERVVADAERRLRQVLRKNDALVRVGEDSFAISALVSDPGALESLQRRLTTAVRAVPLPARLEPSDPVVTGASADDVARMTELAAMDAWLLPQDDTGVARAADQ